MNYYFIIRVNKGTYLLNIIFKSACTYPFEFFFYSFKAYESNNTIQYTTPVMFDELCFVVPKAQQMSQWRAIFTAFDVRLWYCLAGSFMIALSAWTLIRRTKNKPYTLTLLSINLFRVFLMVPLNRVPNNVSERLMVVSTVLFGFIMATSLQAVMVKYLSYPKYERDVATVQELYDTGMPVLSASNNLILLFESDERPLFVKMSDRFSIVNNKSLDILGEVASKRVMAYYYYYLSKRIHAIKFILF